MKLIGQIILLTFQTYQDQISSDNKLKAKALADLTDPDIEDDKNLQGPLTIINTEEEEQF